jgi:hypothetical protein
VEAPESNPRQAFRKSLPGFELRAVEPLGRLESR